MANNNFGTGNNNFIRCMSLMKISQDAEPVAGPSHSCLTTIPRISVISKATPERILSASISLDLLECSNCCEFLTLPVRLCQGGHNLCYSCYVAKKSCQVCGNRFLTETQNLSTENLLKKVYISCCFVDFGCKEAFPVAHRNLHEDNCVYRQ